MEKLESMIEVVEFCRTRNLPAGVVGRWVWVRFEEKPSAEVRAELKTAGFKFVAKRGQWAHNCGFPSRSNGGAHPARKYGWVDVAEEIA